MATKSEATRADETWHALTPDEALEQLSATLSGLSQEEAARRLEEHGRNEIQDRPHPSALALFVSQFTNPLVYILAVAAAISLAVGEAIDAIVIGIVVLLNAVIGYIQEAKAEEAIQALRNMAAPLATVRRSSEAREVQAAELVPGDIVVLQTGDKIPADVRLLESANMKVDESALTGESVGVEKHTAPIEAEAGLADRDNLAFLGTNVVYGRGVGVVFATGMATAMGQIAASLGEIEDEATPLQRSMASLSRKLGIIALAASALILVGGLFRGIPLLEIVIFAIAAAVSAIPEGLPVVVTIVLALGMRRLAKRNAIIRRLPAVETLGACSFVCTDKTGTLTQNQMTVRAVYAGGRAYEVTGEGYLPEGEFFLDGQAVNLADQQALQLGLEIGALCNDSRLQQEDGRYRILGDPTEGALLVLAEKGGLDRAQEERVSPRLSEIPFESERQYMATLHDRPGVGLVAYVKGSPERVLSFATSVHTNDGVAPLGERERERIEGASLEMARQALRVLALGYRPVPPGKSDLSTDDVEQDLVLVGLVGMIDPPREEAKQAIAAAHRAGIDVVMITGDNKVTAQAIASQLGLPAEEVITGGELVTMSDDELAERVERVRVYARVEPQHKLRIIGALKAKGEVVAMTGDGVNDAPALKSADIGIAMGITGTDVAKEASDMILVDDNFASIINAVEEGRNIFANIRRVVFYLLSTNGGELITLGLAILIGLPLPVTAVQILWINLVTDGLVDKTLGVEPGHPEVLQEPPRRPGVGIIYRGMLFRLVYIAAIMAAGTLGLFYWALTTGDEGFARTVAFTALAAFQWFNALNARSTQSSAFKIGFFSNKWLLGGITASFLLQLAVVELGFLQQAFGTQSLGLTLWLLIMGVATLLFVVEEVRKAFAPDLFAEGR